MPINQIVTMGQLASNCFTSEQQRANAFAQALQVTFPLTATALNYGSVTPSVDQQNIPWIRLNSDGTLDRLYVYINGFWTAPNPIAANAQISEFWRGSLNNLATYDGGEGTFNLNNQGTSGVTITPSIAITSTTGPMWQVDTAMMGVMPIGVTYGAPIKDAYGNQINGWGVGQTGGEIQHTLTPQENAPHAHTGAPVYAPGNTWQGGGNLFGPMIPPYVQNTGVSGGDTISGVVNTPIGHNTLPPYLAGLWITRTGRTFYRV